MSSDKNKIQIKAGFFREMTVKLGEDIRFENGLTLARGWIPPTNQLAMTGGDHYSFNFSIFKTDGRLVLRETYDGDDLGAIVSQHFIARWSPASSHALLPAVTRWSTFCAWRLPTPHCMPLFVGAWRLPTPHCLPLLVGARRSPPLHSSTPAMTSVASPLSFLDQHST